MQRDLETYLVHAIDALDAIASYINGKTKEEYLTGRQLRSSVEREFITVGEVLSRIIHYYPETRVRVEHARKIANFRNVLVHDYDVVDGDLVWDLANRSAPLLRQPLYRWLQELQLTSS
jgi:uncharacterized protein with HEPN domain